MPRSTTVWAAALVLASFSGSGPLLTTAEAMPAPGPRETPARPRYYFPRHIKRQIVTNTTAPAAPTTSATSSDSSSSSSSSQLESRKFDVTEALSQFFSESRSDSSSSSLLFSKSEADRPSPVTTTPDVPLTPVPISSSYQIPPLPGTGNQLPSSAPVLSKPNEEPPSSAPQSTLVGGRSSENIVTPSPPSTPTQQPKSEPQAAIPSSPVQAPSSAGLPSVILQPTPSSSPYSSSAPTQQPKSEPQEVVPSTPVQGPSSAGLPPVIIQPTPSPSPSLQPSREPAPVDSSTAARNPLDPVLGSTGLLPGIIVPASSAASSPSSASYSVVPGVSVQPTPSASAPAGGLVSSLSGGIGATGSFAISVVLPTPQPPAPVSSSRAIGSVGSVPEIVISPTSAPAATLQSSAPAASSFQGPFIIPGSTGGAIPSSVIQPTASQGLVGGLISSVLNVPAALPSSEVGSSGLLPSSGIVQPTPLPVASSRQQTLSIQPSSGGIVVGITTALGTSAPAPSASGPVVTSGAIPTSEAVRPSASLNLPSILSSLVSEVTGILPSGSAGPTAPGSPSPTPVPSAAPSVAPSPAPSAAPSGTLPPLVSSLVSDVTSLVSGVVSYTQVSVPPSIVSSLVSVLPTASVPVPLLSGSSIVSNIASAISSGLIPSGALSTVSSGLNPTPSGVVPTPSNSASITPLLPSETPTITPSAASSRLTRPAASGTPSGILPSGISGSGVSSAPTVTPSPIQSSHVPASEVPASIASSVPGSSASAVPPSSGNATLSETPTFVLPTTTAGTPPASVSATPLPDVTSKPTPVQSQKPIGTDSATSMIVGTSIVQETTSNAQPSPTSSGIPSSLPKMIAPPEGVPTQYPANSFMGQVCFKWPLNYPFVSANDGGNQIFHYLPKAIADGLNISESEVRNIGLKPLDTTAYQGFITTLALFTIPSDLQGKLQAQLRNPADPFWHNQDSTVNDLTNLINTACPLPAGKLPGDGSNPNQPAGADPATTNTGGPGDGGALGGDINASRPVNASAAGIATGAIVGAIAYGAAMFFVARRYRNKRVAHQRSSSVPSTGSRMTYGSIPGGAAAWMHGARNGRITPGSRGSHGSDSSQGRSVRTQQISAPVMAENSLGWN